MCFFLHTSGHADKEAFEELNQITNPDQIIIIHTINGSKGRDLFSNVVDVNDNEEIVV